ncbi:ABC transporter substrate-binding protein [Cypionkella sp. TWP1-2-1b2]|uniref:ABC transporter substrate-binding protein n=1 Tax=Cypionkella sp. TWP1-2-1b2 TaxID=2804675 RepID=UPI003CF98D95
MALLSGLKNSTTYSSCFILEGSGLGHRRLTGRVALTRTGSCRLLLSYCLDALLSAINALVLPLTAQADSVPVQGGTLIYLDQKARTALYPPAGGFYPNGGVMNQITDKLTWQNPATLEIEPWVAESSQINADFTEFTFKLRPGLTFSDGTPLDAAAVAANFDSYGVGKPEQNFRPSEVLNNYAKSEVIDPLTVKFTVKKPSPRFLQGTSRVDPVSQPGNGHDAGRHCANPGIL